MKITNHWFWKGLLLIAIIQADAKTLVVPNQYKKIKLALKKAVEGDTIFVKKGVYRENIKMIKGLCIIGEDKKTTILNGRRRGPVILAEDQCLIQGFTITNGLSGISCENVAPRILDNIIFDNKGSGIQCVISLPRILNNIIIANRWHGIQCEGAKSLNTAIENNIIGDNGYSGIYCSNKSQILIQNNIIFKNRRYGIYCDETSKKTLILYNDFFNNRFPYSTHTTVSLQKNFSKDPLFVDPFNFNFLLQKLSPCQKAGRNNVNIGLLTSEALNEQTSDFDNDGVLDKEDLMPTVAEDKDGHEDQDGVPDYDNDQDGIFDVQDKCPNKAETFNGYLDEDGCPDEDMMMNRIN